MQVYMDFSVVSLETYSCKIYRKDNNGRYKHIPLPLVRRENDTCLYLQIQKITDILASCDVPIFKVKLKYSTLTEIPYVNVEKLNIEIPSSIEIFPFEKITFQSLSKKRVRSHVKIELSQRLLLEKYTGELTQGLAEYFSPVVTKIGHHLFWSGIYAEYINRLHIFIKSLLLVHPHLAESMLNPTTINTTVLKHWMSYIEDKSSRFSKVHKFMLKTFRNLFPLTTSSNEKMDKNINSFLREVLDWMMTKVQMVDVWQHFLKQVLCDTQVRSDNIATAIKEYEEKIILKFHGVRNSHGTKSDLYLQGDMPCQLFTHILDKEIVTFIRTPNITTSTTTEPRQRGIMLEMEEYLGNCKMPTLLVNFMHRLSDNEKELVKVVEHSETKSSVFHVVSLDRNSDFYFQTGNFSELNIPKLNEAKVFIGIFFNEMFSPDTPTSKYHWSPKTKLKEWSILVEATLLLVHQHYFGGMDILNHTERLEFIDIADLALIREYIKLQGIKHCFMSCRVSVDRDPTFYTGLDIFLMRSNGIPITIEVVEKLMAKLFTPCLMMYHRLVMPEYLSRLKLVADRLQRYPPFPQDIFVPVEL